MMRAALLAGGMLFAAPLAAQDHSAHGMDADAQPEMDHCAMGHLPPEKCPPKDDAEPTAAMDDTMAGMSHGSHGGMADKSAPGAAPEDALPPRALEGPEHAADAIWGSGAMAPARRQLAREHGGISTGMILVERLEARIATDGGEDGYVWDAQGWYGGDINRFVLKTEGEGEIGGALEDAEIQALYSRAIGPFFDLQAGARFDPEPDSLTHLVVGVAGLAPYMFHVEGALFLSDRGDLTARIEGEYDQKITQRLILQPRIEAEFAAQDIPEREIGAGVTKIEPGLRLRYEIVPEFAPYIGVEYEAKLGETADIARAGGEDPDGLKALIGLRAWF
ncbi:copper resistance protein B [Alteriqipengyuania lutimaris]|uniref:Copper resistance protein B n=1 Tax=Alteriqipengyuania lutimaris TaxID=1538146 RepID=A0A395LLW4_9SPHN|nr:copper resistance protein B [Alteriqipengyuania lutimaris]MBB3033084.1 copper resistance protein B [Alteriqipengyuania lutimaris]RDS77851.1 copper resistance protein B [Alteriqipengyuania lutimaris]